LLNPNFVNDWRIELSNCARRDILPFQNGNDPASNLMPDALEAQEPD
jgi:hypothetical protein